MRVPVPGVHIETLQNPARYTYAHLELPGLTEAVEKGDWKVAAEQARILENALSRNATLLRAAREDLRISRR